MPKKQEKETISSSLKKLEEISSWFKNRREVDLEKALAKVKEGAVIIAVLKNRLKEAENEFKEIKRSIADGE